MVLFPNAKINLGLHVTGKRPDDFHNIETIFLPIGLCDVLEIVESGKGLTQLTITGAKLDGKLENNLVFRAWQLMNEIYKIPPVDIHLHKLIPTGAGLGGGSSDAAFMLKGLNELFQCNVKINELEQLAAKLGSDCAFFIRNIPAYAEGRGEILQSLELDLNNYRILLINPAIHVSTREAYEGVIPQKPAVSLKEIIKLNEPDWQKNIKNDFERSVFQNHPEIQNIKEDLINSGAVYAAMSGSGSTVYGIFENSADFRAIEIMYKKYFTWIGELIQN
jgi:4-diphosphocytidyl-2-C-methyl-D-erythritol kinase